MGRRLIHPAALAAVLMGMPFVPVRMAAQGRTPPAEARDSVTMLLARADTLLSTDFAGGTPSVLSQQAASATTSALDFARRALVQSARRGDSTAQARAHNAIASAHFRLQRYDSALVNGRKALAILTPRDTTQRASGNQIIAWSLFASQASLDSATRHLNEALALHQQLNNPGALQRALYGAAWAYTVRRGRPANTDELSLFSILTDSVIGYYQRSVRAGLSGGDSALVGSAYRQLSNAWSSVNRPDSALAYSRSAWAIANARRDVEMIFTDIGAIYRRFVTPGASGTYNRDSALVWARKGLDAATTMDGTRLPEQLERLALAHREGGRLDSVRVYLREAAAVARRQNSLASLESALSALAGQFSQQNFWDSALLIRREILSVALARARDGSLANRGGLLRAWSALGNAHYAAGAPDSAKSWLRRVTDSATADGAFATQGGAAWMSLANAYLTERVPDSALIAARHAERLSAFMGPPPVIASQRNSARMAIASAFLQRSDLDSALSVLNDEARMENELPFQINALAALANVYVMRGQWDSALVHRRRSLQIMRQYPQFAPSEGQVLIAIGSDFRSLGLVDSALTYFRLAQQLGTQRSQRGDVMSALQWIATSYHDSDVLDSSLYFARNSLAMAIASGARGREATLLNNIGITYSSLGQQDSARVYVERALHLHRAVRNFAGEATTLSNLASFRFPSGVDDSVFVLIDASLAIRSRLQDRSGAIVARLNLSRALAARGQFDSAMSEAREVLASARLLKHREFEGRALQGIGRVFALRKQVDSAQRYFGESANAMRQAGFTRGIRVMLAEMGELFRASGTPGSLGRAAVYFDSASAVVDNARRGAGGDQNEVALSESQVDLFGGWARAWAGRSSDVGSARSAASALAAVERGRAQSLVDMVTRLESSTGLAAATANRARPGADLAKEVDSLLAPLRASKSAALSYLLAGDTLFTWLLSPDGTLTLQQPVAISEMELNRLVRSSRRGFSADDARAVRLDPDALAAVSDPTTVPGNPSDDWRRLSELLLPADLTEKVPEGTPIVIVPHGSIGLVPFSALSATRGAGRSRDLSATSATGARRGGGADANTVSLGTRNPLRFTPSFAALRASEARARVAVAPALRTPAAQRAWRSTRGTSISTAAAKPMVRTAALVVGNPSMPFVYSGRWTNRSQLQPLPGAEAESRTIAAQLGASSLTGKAATETAIRARMQSAPLIHFATHGLAYGTASAARRSFVAFAPDSANDGLLTLGELMDDRALTLNAELVVLSACQTGLGDMKKAEGSIGLQRAFLAKGARSVLVSLWNVDDKATRLLMEKFYAYWLDPTTVRTKARALQMAQEAVRRMPGYADPKYWAAFQLVGAE